MPSHITTSTSFLSSQPAVPPPLAKPAGERTFSFPDHLQQQSSKTSEPKPQTDSISKKREPKRAADPGKEAEDAQGPKGHRKLTGKPIVRRGDPPAASEDAQASDGIDSADQDATDAATQLAASGELSPEDLPPVGKPAKPVATDASADAADPGAGATLAAGVAAAITTTTAPTTAAPKPQPGLDAVKPRVAGVADARLLHPGEPDTAGGASPADSSQSETTGVAGTVSDAAVAAGKADGKHKVASFLDDAPPVTPGETPTRRAAAQPAPVEAAPAPSAAADAVAVPPSDGPPAKSAEAFTDDASAAAALASKAQVPTPHNAATAPQAAAPAPEARFAEANHSSIVSDVRTQLMPHGGTMQIRLDPPELGALQVLVEMRNGSMSATFQTSNDDATRLLSHSLGQLKTALEAQGVTVDKIQVQQSPRDHHAPGGDDRQQQRTPQEDQQSRQDQQRKEMLQHMWRKLSIGSDPIDLVA